MDEDGSEKPTPPDEKQLLQRSARPAWDQCLTKTYEEEYQMATLNDHNNTLREIKPMTEIKTTKHIIQAILTQHS